MTDDKSFSDNRALIREILLREWDPIGVCGIAGAPNDEYDVYINDVYALIADTRASQEQIADYLLDVQSRRMRLRVTNATLDKCRRAASLLIAARQQLGFS